MRIGMGLAGPVGRSAAVSTSLKERRFSKIAADTVRAGDQGRRAAESNFLREWTAEEDKEDKENTLISLTEAAEESSDDRSEAAKIYEAAFKGGENPIENLRSASKVPYGHLAKDGVIIYNGVLFTCDEKTNSICLGDVTDKKQVINITLSGGGHLKVNRANLGQLSKAIGMFSPEDVNLIMRAIHQDTKVQSMQKEIEDMEAGVGEEIASGGDAAETGHEMDKE